MDILSEINKRSRSIASVLVLFTLAAVPAFGQRALLEKIIQRRVLPNGLEVIVLENHGVPLATVEITVRNGSFTQSPSYAGLAHMYEHMFFKANDAYPLPDQYIDKASELGAVFNASTREEQVNYYLTVPSDSVEGAMRYLVAALLGPKFRQDELERERQVVIGEYDRNESQPFFRLEESMGRRLWGDQWSRKNVIGDRQVIATVTPEKMRTIRDLYYVPNNSVLLISGDVNPEAAFAAAERIYGVWPRGDDPFVKAPIPPIPPLTKNDAVIVEEPVNAVTVLIQWQGPSVRKDEDATFVADVFSDVLNNPQSRFQRRLVDSGLWQGVLVNYYTLNNVGPITISGQTTPEKLREALQALFTELRAVLGPGYISQEELDATKANRAVTTAFGLERSSESSHTIGFWWSVSGLEYYMKYNDEMAKRTAKDLRAYATKYIIDQPHVIGVMLPSDDRRRIGLNESELLTAGARVKP
ncbi:MAG: insulinase family protein [Gemmatimonadetes bacterium]|nr:insulinase family protein [Gemmatimonadota bacterium]MBI3504592.1 insulinase family protein [Pseudomonadota bacterium]